MTQHIETTKHTSGPWTIHNNIGRKSELGIVADGAPCIIAVMGNAKEWPVEAHANARLIAAAPELLEACKSMLAWMQACSLDTVKTIPNALPECIAAKHAITKATQGSTL